ncbi:cyclopropane-fatty-acyl-phospholipid synthase [Stereum hirsutum FP-91666 SS1]|uniref:cyclopropane-fatty-acyl-phospholipid synthase n=1 Tax=Stereum hirsutum (strain FP-91666) TaxID=721885 RepID=UPI0004449EF3|nr:cyclopropane-fatty-acyl-phospholipid synthase [Stereum hirsutum FP-91666 SS1]EIM81614.1 cyclopropane-fatty-acyl-phospholipid synthase [Stereum hirsutum FP-91666 SS1]
MSNQLLDTPAKHPFSLTGLVDNVVGNITERALATSYSPVSRLAQTAVVSVLQKITYGTLRIITSDHTYNFGSARELSDPSAPNAELKVISDTFWIRLCLMSDLGFSEAYMYGEVECDDLIPLFLIFIRNKENLEGLNSRFSWLLGLPQRLTSYRFLNTLSNSRSNISAHYDLSNEMFQAFLSRDMTYSCAIFPDLDGDVVSSDRTLTSKDQLSTRLLSTNFSRTNATIHDTPSSASTSSPSSSSTPLTTSTPISTPPSTSTPSDPDADPLHTAQLIKLQHITKKARIFPGHRVLEIGSGWGSLALHIVTSIPDTQVDSITLSTHQYNYVRGLVKKRGLQDRVRVHLVDYRNMPQEWDDTFDRVVSVEMVEAVGEENMESYWACIDRVVKRKGGAGVVQGITITEGRFEKYKKEVDFIRKWIFPGGLLPSLSLLLSSMQTATSGRFVVESVSNIGPHYARTLREWRRRFVAYFDVIEEALKKEYPGIFDGKAGEKELRVFWRKWIFYFSYCEVGFTTRLINDHIITFTREGNEDMSCDVFE